MDEFLGFPRRERVKPGRTTPEYRKALLVPFAPTKGTGALSQIVNKPSRVWRIIQNHLSKPPN